MSKGDIVLVPFPFTDLSGQKVRPALILHTSKKGGDCVVAFISSQNTKAGGEFDVSTVATPENGLKVDSIIKVDKLATLQKKIILGELGTLEAASLTLVDAKLKTLFQLS